MVATKIFLDRTLINGQLSGLYAITESQAKLDDQYLKKIEILLKGGVSIIQYRNKNNDKLNQFDFLIKLKLLCNKNNALLIINDDLQLSKKLDADGIHLGKNDCSLNDAKEILGNNKIIGVSCYNDLSLAMIAEQQGADYVAFGRFFPSKTKPDAVQAEIDLLQQAKKQLHIPIVAIGGITMQNARQVINAGADMIAVIDGLFSQADLFETARTLANNFSGDHHGRTL